MVNLYVNRIIREAGQPDAFTISNVPHLWNTNTLIELNKRGFDGQGHPLVAA